MRRLEERAIRMGWEVPQSKRKKILARLIKIVEDKKSDDRYVVLASRTLASADLRQQELELARQIATTDKTAGTLAGCVEEAEKRWADIERERSERATDGDAGSVS